MKKQISPEKLTALVFGVIILCFAVVSLTSASWTTPTATPPGNNVSAPLNIGSSGQSKVGGLELNTGGAVNGLLVYGKVGLGTASPTEALSITTGTAWTAQSVFGLGLSAKQNISTNFPSYSTSNTAFLNAYYSVDISGEGGDYARFLDVAVKGSPDGTNGAGIIRFLANSKTSGSNPAELMRITGESGYVGIGTASPASLLSVGSSSKFQVDSSGNIVKINNVTYSWPSSQGTSSTCLKNNGSGTLTWGTCGGAGEEYTFTIGEVRTLSPGSNATVTISYGSTANDVIFNFGIPSGANGADGQKGDKGDTGATGITGDVGPMGMQGPVGPEGAQGTCSCP